MKRMTRTHSLLLALLVGWAATARAQTSTDPEPLVIAAENVTAEAEAVRGEPRADETVRAGDVIRYALTFTNPTSRPVRDIVLHNPLPEGLRFVGGTARADRTDMRVEYSIDGGETFAVSLGWDQKLDLPAGWTLSSQLERRFGLDDASLGDPVRALPFPQVERDRLSAGLGVQWRGGAGTRFFSARGEYTDGDLINGYRIEALGDMDLGKDAALLMRHDWLRNERLYGPRTTFERRDHSLLGIAFRPSASNTLNALAKVEWRRTVRPDGFGDPTLAGDNARLIGAADLAWTPEPSAQAVLRYAIRGNRYENPTLDDLVVHSRSHFVGSSLERRVHGRVFGRLDGRALHVTTTGDTRWSLAPALVIDFSEIELEAGYRAGNLRDIDIRRPWRPRLLRLDRRTPDGAERGGDRGVLETQVIRTARTASVIEWSQPTSSSGVE